MYQTTYKPADTSVCDFCGETSMLPPGRLGTLPDFRGNPGEGWDWFTEGGETVHICPHCQTIPSCIDKFESIRSEQK